MKIENILIVLITIFVVGCSNENSSIINESVDSNSNKGFALIPSSQTGITFKNEIIESLDLTFLSYPYIYNGGGVSTGDIDNDGLIDIYFTSNQGENKLYRNLGDFKFEDITLKSKTTDSEGWTTGVNMIDINNDGWLDIYICKSSSPNDSEKRSNKLYINEKNNTFTEQAKEWGLDNIGFSVQSYFFDYDRDGDLDMYLVNHRIDFKNNTRISGEIQSQKELESTDYLYRNVGNYYIDVTNEAGLLSKNWGLSTVTGDFNNDGWTDVYVANDYLEPDNLYINNQDGTFTDEILDYFRHISFYSMGSDYADINNDLTQDLLVLDMSPDDHVKSKTNMASMNVNSFQAMVDIGYHHQYMFNMLMLNNGNNTYSEISQLAGMSKTDWSWAPLIADFDNDGLKDFYITNGISKDIGNRDSRNLIKQKNSNKEYLTIEALGQLIPENKVLNRMYHNQGDLTTKKVNKEWGLTKPSYSNGAAYADLDNDGDLDLIVNNTKDKAFIYRNNSRNNFVQFDLTGPTANIDALGTKVFVYSGSLKQVKEIRKTRGFESSVSNELTFGLANHSKIDSVIIRWPNSAKTILNDVGVNKRIELSFDDADKYKGINTENFSSNFTQTFTKIKNQLGLAYKHQENNFNDYRSQVLLPYVTSRNGPYISSADVNGDGLEDVFIGGAKGMAASLFFQNSDGTYTNKNQKDWDKEKKFEDLDIKFIDIDGDNDLDLYIVSGDTEERADQSIYQDRLYINNGSGKFSRNISVLPIMLSSGECVEFSDIDNDGDLDVFVGGRIIPDKYPFPATSFLLINNNGKFENVTLSLAPEINEIGMVTDASFSDYDNDGDKDLIIIGEWMNITILNNEGGVFTKQAIPSIENTLGMWFTIEADDIDNDGDVDYLIGNLGLNSKFKANEKKEFHVFCDDFDNNGSYDVVLSNKYNGVLVPSRGKECSSQQMPFVSQQFPTFQDFAEANIEDVLGVEKMENALHYQADILHSILLKNNGDGSFEIVKLPNELQFGPITDFEIINLKGGKQIISIGNIFNAEVETVRYDASFGNVFSYDNGVFSVLSNNKSGLQNTGDSKKMTILEGENKTLYLLVTNNDGPLDVYQINE